MTTHSINGNLTFQTAPELLAQSADWMSNGEGTLTIDFKSAGRADSAGIALILEWIELANNSNRDLKLINIPDQLKEFVETNGLSKLIKQYAD